LNDFTDLKWPIFNSENRDFGVQAFPQAQKTKKKKSKTVIT